MTARRKILVLDGDTGAALTIVQSLGRAGYDVWLAGPENAKPGKAFTSRFVAEKAFYPDPLVDKRAFTDWILALQRTQQFALIVPPSERTLTPLHEIRADLGSAAGALPPDDAYALGFDKESMRRLCESLGIPVPPNLTIAALADLSLPSATVLDDWLRDGAVVCKSVRSKAWRGERAAEHAVQMVLDRATLTDVAGRMLVDAEVQLQRWVPGRGVGVELLADHGEVVLFFAHERVHELPLTGGGSSYRRAVTPPPKMLEDAKRLMRALRWHGVAMVEFRRELTTSDGDYWMIELNGRFWGSLPLAQFAGVDFPLALVELILDGKRPATPRPRRVYARQLSRDVQWLKSMTRVRIGDLRRLVQRRPAPTSRRLVLGRPLGQSLVEWGRVLLGREVWDGAALDDPRPIWTECKALVEHELGALFRRGEDRLLALGAQRAWTRPLFADTTKILVLCSGNICRSPYAALRLAQGGRFEVRGAALVGPAGNPTPDHVQQAARARGIELGDHCARLVSDDDLAWAELILIMDAGHARRMRQWPEVRHKVRWLGAVEAGQSSIADPIDLDLAATDEVLAQIDRAVKIIHATVHETNPGCTRRL